MQVNMIHRTLIVFLLSLLLASPVIAATKKTPPQPKAVAVTARAAKSAKATTAKSAKDAYLTALKAANDEFVASVRQAFEGYTLAVQTAKKAESKEDIKAARDTFLGVLKSASEMYAAAKLAAKEPAAPIVIPPEASTSTDSSIPTVQ